MPLTLVCPAPEWNLHEDGSLIHLDLPQAELRQMSLFPGSICIPLPARHACSLTSDLALLSRQTRQYPEAYGETVGNLIQAAVRPIMRSPDQGAVSPHSPLSSLTRPSSADKAGLRRLLTALHPLGCSLTRSARQQVLQRDLL